MHMWVAVIRQPAMQAAQSQSNKAYLFAYLVRRREGNLSIMPLAQLVSNFIKLNLSTLLIPFPFAAINSLKLRVCNKYGSSCCSCKPFEVSSSLAAPSSSLCFLLA